MDGSEKTLDDHFRDWENDAIGFGYGTGEEHTLKALGLLLKAIPDEGCYDYTALEAAVGGATAWLLIACLCRGDMIEYGSSPRYGWLTDKGVRLKQYVDDHTHGELYEIVAGHNEGGCYRDVCNCDGPKCMNPFWWDSNETDAMMKEREGK